MTDIPSQSNPESGIGLSTLVKYLIGDRQSIISIANSRWSIWIGAVFVLAAGFAREYDGESLWDEPWHLAIPFGASLVAATTLYLLVFVTAAIRRQTPLRFLSGWYRFVGLFWMTAPMAFLYAIPYERMFSEVGAVEANLWTLALVALWRVVLIARVIQVVFNWYPVASAIITVFFADVIAVIVASNVEFPVTLMATMGGIRFSPAEHLLGGIGMLFQIVSFILLPFVLIAALVVCATKHGLKPVLTESHLGNRASLALWVFVSASLLVWIPILPGPQREQQLGYEVESLMTSGRIEEGLSILSQHPFSDFPPNWSPPPHLAYSNYNPSLEKVFVALAKMDRPLDSAWEDIIALKARSVFQFSNILEFSPEDLEVYAAWLERIRLGPRIAAKHFEWIRKEDEIPEPLRSSLDRIKVLAKRESPHDFFDDWTD